MPDPDEKKPSNCPFIPPYDQETRSPLGQVTAVNRIPMPCMGKPDPEKGGGCAVWNLCQGEPSVKH